MTTRLMCWKSKRNMPKRNQYWRRRKSEFKLRSRPGWECSARRGQCYTDQRRRRLGISQRRGSRSRLLNTQILCWSRDRGTRREQAKGGVTWKNYRFLGTRIQHDYKTSVIHGSLKVPEMKGWVFILKRRVRGNQLSVRTDCEQVLYITGTFYRL